MKVLHVVPLNYDKQIPVYLRHQVNSLNAHSITSNILGFRGSEINIFHPIKSFTSIRKCLLEIQQSDADLIHSHWGSLLGALTVLGNRKMKPVILTLRGSDVNRNYTESLIIFCLKITLTRFASKRATSVICVSENLKKLIQGKLTNVQVIPDGIPLSIFFPRDKEHCRKLLGWQLSEKFVLFHCGSRPIEKNLSLAEKVISHLKQKMGKVNFIVIEFNLTQEQLSVMYSAADILLFTSLNEGSPNVVREAIACGLPVVSVEVGDVSKWIKSSECGAVTSYDHLELASACYTEIIANRRGKTYNVEHFSTVKSATKVLGVYQSTVNQ
jgi:glycosyltransferase involved in cell wall biosynthesis